MMQPFYQDASATIYHAKAETVLQETPDHTFDLIVTDPPYFRVKGEWWDRQWDSAAGFLAWMDALCVEWRRVLKPNGSLYVFASPQMAYGVEGVIRRHFNVLNSIRWYKAEGWHNKASEESLRSYLTPWEACIFAEQQDQYANPYEAASYALHKEVYGSIGRYVQAIRERAGLFRKEVSVACSPSGNPTGLCWNWENGLCLPTLEQFVKLLKLCGDSREYEALRTEYETLRTEYEALRTEYETLRTEYETLRRPFALANGGLDIDRWDFPTVPPRAGKHPCEKPVSMLEHIIRTSSRPGALVLDCFMGTGATLRAAKNLGRRAVGVDATANYCEQAKARIAQQDLFAALEAA